jgi:flavin-dependent dehydrogenase
VRQGARVEVTDRVRVDGVEVGAHVVVGADGANGSSARAWALGAAIERGVAFEAEVPYAAIPWSPRRDVALIDIGDIPGGYGWLFPKGDHVNVGVGAWGSEGPRIREHWSRLCARIGVPTDSARNARGHRLPMRTRATRLSDDSHLLVGDAAGLVDPISGDGIYECFVSSELAAEAIAARVGGDAHALIAYDAAIDARLSGLHAAGMAVKRVFDLAPRLTWTVATSGFVWATIERLLRGELASPQDATPLRRLPIGLMSVVGSSVARRT